MKVAVRDGRKYYCKEKILHTKDGVVKLKDGIVKSHLGKKFFCFEASFADKINKIKRGPAIMLKKDIGSILAYTGINSKSKVLDAGAGSGVLSASLANVSNVVSYENRKEFLEIAKKNFKFLDVKVKLRNKDVYKGISEKNLDLITLDLSEPWKVLKHAHKALKIGGYLVVYSPQITQVLKIVKAKGFIVERVIENIEREWVFDKKRARPKSRMIGHTGFLVFLRKV